MTFQSKDNIKQNYGHGGQKKQVRRYWELQAVRCSECDKPKTGKIIHEAGEHPGRTYESYLTVSCPEGNS